MHRSCIAHTNNTKTGGLDGSAKVVDQVHRHGPCTRTRCMGYRVSPLKPMAPPGLVLVSDFERDKKCFVYMHDPHTRSISYEKHAHAIRYRNDKCQDASSTISNATQDASCTCTIAEKKTCICNTVYSGRVHKIRVMVA